MLSLVIDIQSDIIEGSLVKFSDKGVTPVTSETLYATTVRIPHKAHTNGDYITKMMLKGIEDLCLHIVKEHPKITHEPLHSINYILSTPWIISQSKTVKIEYEKETEISEATIRDIIDADRKQLVATYEDDMIFVEQKIFDVELNGYSVHNYKNKRAKTLQVSFAFTLSSDKIVKKIQAAVSKSLHIHKEYYHSAILLQYLASRELASDGEEYIVLHVHGELTDVVIVKKGFSSYLASFPFGSSTLTRKVCLASKSSFEETGSSLAMYSEAKLNEEQQKKVESALMPIMKGWQAECHKAFQGLGGNISLPHRVHLYAGSALGVLFKKSLEENNFEVVVHEGELREKHIAGLQGVI